jgi:hypothetical protein
MDEYIRADNDFRQRREEAYRFSEMPRGFGGRIHLRHVRSIHNSTQSDDKGSQPQRSQYTSQSSGQQQSSFSPPAPRGRGARGFGGRFGDQPRKIYNIFCGEDKGHTTRMCQIKIQKEKEIEEAEARQKSAEAGLAHCFVPFSLLTRVCGQSSCSFGCFSLAIHKLPGHNSHPHHHYNRPIPKASSQKGTSTLNSNGNSGRNPKLAQSTVLCWNQSTFIERYPTSKFFYILCHFCFSMRNK